MNKRTKAKLEKVLDSLELSKENKNNLRDIFEECSASGGGGRDVVVIKLVPDSNGDNYAPIYTISVNNVDVLSEQVRVSIYDEGITVKSANIYNCLIDDYINRIYYIMADNDGDIMFGQVLTIDINQSFFTITFITSGEINTMRFTSN